MAFPFYGNAFREAVDAREGDGPGPDLALWTTGHPMPGDLQVVCEVKAHLLDEVVEHLAPDGGREPTPPDHEPTARGVPVGVGRPWWNLDELLRITWLRDTLQVRSAPGPHRRTIRVARIRGDTARYDELIMTPAAHGPRAASVAAAPILRTQGSYTRRSGELLFGGSPWGLARLSAPARSWAQSVLRPGAGPVQPASEIEQATARLLVDRGLALPVLPPRAPDPAEIEIVVPVHGSAAPLARLLAALHPADPDAADPDPGTLRVTVVDDGSADADARQIARVCAERQARLIVMPENLGPGGARNAGLAATTAELVAFLDADTLPPRGWLHVVVPHFDDPAVAAVAPRVRGAITGPGPASVLERFETRRGGLDLGAHARRVAPGGQIGYVPTAALVVRRAALPDPPFEPGLRVGEDVDLVWRLVDAGWTVRYLPAAEVHHEVRSGLRAWARRHAAYGSSAVPLERRHPGRLAPATLGWPGLTLLAGALLVVGGRSGARTLGTVAVVAAIGIQVGTQVRRFQGRGLPLSAGLEIAVLGLRSEATAIGHALRREWWPLGALALVLTAAPWPRLRAVARAAVVLAALPTVPDTAHAARHRWTFLRGTRPQQHDAGAPLDPLRHLALRLGADAAYGTGVIGAAVRSRCVSVLLPRYRGRARG